MMVLLMLLYSWKSDASTLYWFVFFGSAFVVATAVFYGATSEGFERWRAHMVEKFDRSKLGKHMQRAASGFHKSKKNNTGGQ